MFKQPTVARYPCNLFSDATIQFQTNSYIFSEGSDDIVQVCIEIINTPDDGWQYPISISLASMSIMNAGKFIVYQ